MIPAALAFLLAGSGLARADLAVSAALEVEPTGPVPSFVPAAPDQLPPAPVYAPAAVVEPGPVATGGQWVFTAQYGWIYMPYGSRYVNTYAASPYAYVYYPSYGWRWLNAPWVVGVGPYPHFGAHGPFAYGWYRSLNHAGHPMAAYYAHPAARPWTSPRPAVGRPVHEARPVATHGPARAYVTPRATSPRMAAYRGPMMPARRR
jgi:hypothetical protein